MLTFSANLALLAGLTFYIRYDYHGMITVSSVGVVNTGHTLTHTHTYTIDCVCQSVIFVSVIIIIIIITLLMEHYNKFIYSNFTI